MNMTSSPCSPMDEASVWVSPDGVARENAGAGVLKSQTVGEARDMGFPAGSIHMMFMPSLTSCKDKKS